MFTSKSLRLRMNENLQNALSTLKITQKRLVKELPVKINFNRLEEEDYRNILILTSYLSFGNVYQLSMLPYRRDSHIRSICRSIDEGYFYFDNQEIFKKELKEYKIERSSLSSMGLSPT